MKTRKKLMVCLTAGVLVLAVSAAAAFGSVNGYSAYKDAALTLALEEENFSLTGDISVKLDDQSLMEAQLVYAQDGANRSSVISGHDWTEDYSTQYDTTLDGVNTWYNEDNDVYFQSQRSNPSTNLLGFHPEDEMEQRLITFMEIAADTVMGDLKNNFVQVGSEDGKDLYQVNIANSQVPALVNAGLSLMAYTSFGGQGSAIGVVEYEDYRATSARYYEDATGEALPEDFLDNYYYGWTEDWAEANHELIQRYDEVVAGNVHDQYHAIITEKGDTGVLYVKADGSYDYYPSMGAYLATHPEEGPDNMSYYMGEDLILENIACTFSLDEQGRVADTWVQVDFTSVDGSGGRHKLTVEGDLTVSDYGSTVVQPLDVGDRVEAN